MNRILSHILPLGLVIFVTGGSARAQERRIAPELARATFDTAWTLIDRSYYDTTFLNTRWKVLRDSLRPLAMRANTNSQLRVVLQVLLTGVGESHFGLIPSELAPALNTPLAIAAAAGGARVPDAGKPGAARLLAPPGNIGASFRLVDGQLTVFKVDSNGPAWRAGIRPGDAVSRIDTTHIAAAFSQLDRIGDKTVRRQAGVAAVMHANTQLSGTVGDTVTLEVRSASTGALRTVSVARGMARGVFSRVGNLPPMNALLDVSEQTVSGPHGARRVGIIGFSVWLPVLSPGLVDALERFRSADGMVIDLRGNPGGFAIMISLVSGHMLDSTYQLGTMRERALTLHIDANPQANPFRGPVAVLIDPLSGSTSEFFAGGMQALGRVRVFGDTSAGEAIPAVLDRLPNGDVMLHGIADLVDAKGRRVEGNGVDSRRCGAAHGRRADGGARRRACRGAEMDCRATTNQPTLIQ